MFPHSSPSNKTALPAAVIAARENTFFAASEALFKANGGATAARAALAENCAGLAAVEAELAGLPRPGVNDADIKAYRERKETLEIKAEEYRRLVEQREIDLHALDQAVVAAHEAVKAATADLDAPAPKARPVAADLSRLQSEETKARTKANEARRKLDEVERNNASALKAFADLGEQGAPQADAQRALSNWQRAREKIAAADADWREREAEANEIAQSRAQVEETLDRERRVAEFEIRLHQLERRRPSLEATIAICNQAGAALGGLKHACDKYSAVFGRTVNHHQGRPADESEKVLMKAPHFVGAARVPKFNSDGFFLINNYRHDYAQFDPRDDIINSLLPPLKEREVDLRAAINTAFNVFDCEYVKLAHVLLEGVAALYGWRADRDALFNGDREIARSYVAPAFPLQLRDSDHAIWRDLHLPSLQKSAAPIWSPDWSPERLLELTQRAEAA